MRRLEESWYKLEELGVINDINRALRPLFKSDMLLNLDEVKGLTKFLKVKLETKDFKPMPKSFESSVEDMDTTDFVYKTTILDDGTEFKIYSKLRLDLESNLDSVDRCNELISEARKKLNKKWFDEIVYNHIGD